MTWEEQQVEFRATELTDHPLFGAACFHCWHSVVIYRQRIAVRGLCFQCGAAFTLSIGEIVRPSEEHNEWPDTTIEPYPSNRPDGSKIVKE